jgi:hypothetical protein
LFFFLISSFTKHSVLSEHSSSIVQ